MNIVIITQGVSRVFYPLIKSSHNIVGVIESAPRTYKKNIITFKIIYFVKTILTKFNVGFGLKKTCKNENIPYIFMSSENEKNIQEWLNKISPDLIVIFSMSQLLKEGIYNIPKYGAINLHPAILPKYRGPNPVFWQYYNMEPTQGATVHYVDKGEDTGDILYQESTKIPLGIKAPDWMDKIIGEIGNRLLLKAIEAIENGSAPIISQPKESPTQRAKNLKSEDHKSIINFEDWSIEHIWHVLRGTELWLNAIPQPKGIYYGQRWIVEEYQALAFQSHKVGTIYKYKNRHCLAVKDGCIYLSAKFSLRQIVLNIISKLIG